MVLNLQITVCLWCLYDSHFAWLSVCVCVMCVQKIQTVVLWGFLNFYSVNATESIQILIAWYSMALREYALRGPPASVTN